MKTNPLDTIRGGLEAQDAELVREETAAIQRLAEVRSTRKRVKAAIRALGEEGATNRAPNQSQVRRAVRQLLADNDSLAIEDLKDLVAEKLAADDDRSAVGLKLRLDEVLKGPEVSVVNGRVQPSSAAGPRRTPARPPVSE